MLRTFNNIIAIIGALALMLFLGACESKTEDAVENVVYVDENAVDANVSMDANFSENASDVVAEGPNVVVPPFTDPQHGIGAFKDPGDMEVDNWYTVEFFVAPDEEGLADVSEGVETTTARRISIAPMMRVTLLPDPGFEIRPKTDAERRVGRDMTASWQWDVKPLTGGERTLFAQVEVLQRDADGTVTTIQAKTRRVDVKVKVGTWKGFLTAIQNATTAGDLLGTLFSSWQKTLLALVALIGAASAVWLAIKNWGKPKKEEPETP